MGKMTDEIQRLLDLVCKGYEEADRWMQRYNEVWEDLSATRNNYEEFRNQAVFSRSKLITQLEESDAKVSRLMSENRRLIAHVNELSKNYVNAQKNIEKLKLEGYRLQRRIDIRMGMEALDNE
jgi:predicted  nucleic acid-binding Zn-ribbon protein